MIDDAALLALLRAEREEARADIGRVLDLHIALVAGRADGTAVPPPDVVLRARTRLARGETAFAPGDLVVDWPAVRRRARRISDIVAGHEPDLAPAFAGIAAWLDEVSAEAGARLVARWLSGHEAETDHEHGAALTFVLNHALRPMLRAHAAAVIVGEEPGQWPRGQCPVCDGLPDFAALEPDTGQRCLLCARCDTEWRSARMGCPFCGGAGEVRYYAAGGGAHRLYVCEACRRYLKTVDRRETWLRRPLVIERILTVGLDVVAAREGYRA